MSIHKSISALSSLTHPSIHGRHLEEAAMIPCITLLIPLSDKGEVTPSTNIAEKRQRGASDGRDGPKL
jgi:hypothetical protein